MKSIVQLFAVSAIAVSAVPTSTEYVKYIRGGKADLQTPDPKLINSELTYPEYGADFFDKNADKITPRPGLKSGGANKELDPDGNEPEVFTPVPGSEAKTEVPLLAPDDNGSLDESAGGSDEFDSVYSSGKNWFT